MERVEKKLSDLLGCDDPFLEMFGEVIVGQMKLVHELEEEIGKSRSYKKGNKP